MDPDESAPGVFGDRRAATFGDVIINPLIEQFVEGYHSDHYDELAKRAKDLIEEALEKLKDASGQNVQARVTRRAKDEGSLRQKLVTRNAKKWYDSTKEIWDDIHDLAGVRIILNMPTSEQYDSVGNMIVDIWGKDVLLKQHGGPTMPVNTTSALWVPAIDVKNIYEKEKYIPKNFGYQARHYHAAMKKTQEHRSSKYAFKKHDKVEIQVMSALNSTWADVGHNIFYKQHEYGSPTQQEERLLDSLSGLVSLGDLLLEQLYELVVKRTYGKIQHRDEFGMFLRNMDILNVKTEHLDTNRYQEDFSQSEGIDVLFQFLVQRNENYPVAVRDALKQLGYPSDPTRVFQEKLNSFDPHISPPSGLIAPLCLIRQMLGDRATQGQAEKEHAPAAQCRILINALTLLQTFCGGPAAANDFLSSNLAMSKEERQGLNFVLYIPRRSECLAGKDMRKSDRDALQSVWSWFQRQAAQERSLYGMFFHLAEMEVAQGDSIATLMSRLTIGQLSIPDTITSKNNAN